MSEKEIKQENSGKELPQVEETLPVTEEKVELGKFKDVNALAKAYESLQSEFTKRCQRRIGATRFGIRQDEYPERRKRGSVGKCRYIRRGKRRNLKRVPKTGGRREIESDFIRRRGDGA